MLALELKSFHAIACTNSITRAAKELGISQPTVTSHLRQLEAKYGIELFYRRGKGVYLSEEGEHLLPQVEALLRQAAQVDFQLRDLRDLKKGKLRIGATGPYYIMGVLQQFVRTYPGVELTLSMDNSQRVLASLMDYQLDVIASSFLVEDERMQRILLASDPLVVVVRADHPLAHQPRVSTAELVSYPLLLRESGSMTRDLCLKVFKRAGQAPHRVLEMGSREAIGWAIARGMGASLLPLREVPPHTELRTIPLADISMHSYEYVYCLKERVHGHAIHAFLELVQHSVVQDPHL
ncbi:LysR substrate-binding domain-containing protein [Alcaligenes endophyticus]|uniref:LysR family transcriptional regulator n=1 Tax=Alcaligenes endophyticus TaxID=1929088 RepID=A0ABT8EIG2_9BURK|nr:LysR substrate-binding domain-containing protein [Alcaligenes endophyticus]MCX5592573.1 LysR substrate-binding domain-containing protein [Alcaligenes endophyticus]MDN4121079.1 LysR family transcriptional regulator [Alcaligenes endophyticus]